MYSLSVWTRKTNSLQEIYDFSFLVTHAYFFQRERMSYLIAPFSVAFCSSLFVKSSHKVVINDHFIILKVGGVSTMNVRNPITAISLMRRIDDTAYAHYKDVMDTNIFSLEKRK